MRLEVESRGVLLPKPQPGEQARGDFPDLRWEAAGEDGICGKGIGKKGIGCGNENSEFLF